MWPRLHEVLLAKLRSAYALDFSRAAVDGSHIRACHLITYAGISGSPAGAPSTAPVWAANAGSWSVHSPTCTGPGACGSAGRSATTST